VFVFVPLGRGAGGQRGNLAVVSRWWAGQRGLVTAALATAWDGCCWCWRRAVTAWEPCCYSRLKIWLLRQAVKWSRCSSTVQVRRRATEAAEIFTRVGEDWLVAKLRSQLSDLMR
jgi:hypothetical protein